MDKFQRRASLIGTGDVPRTEIPTLVGDPLLQTQNGVLVFQNQGTDVALRLWSRDADGLLTIPEDFNVTFSAPNGGPIPASDVVEKFKAVGATTVGGVVVRRVDASLAKDCVVVRVIDTSVDAIEVLGGDGARSVGLPAKPHERARATRGDYLGQTGAQLPVYIAKFEDRTSASVNRAVDAVARNVEDADARLRAPSAVPRYAAAQLIGARAYVQGQGVWLLDDAHSVSRVAGDDYADALDLFLETQPRTVLAADIAKLMFARDAWAAAGSRRAGLTSRGLAQITDIAGRDLLAVNAVDGYAEPRTAMRAYISSSVQLESPIDDGGIPLQGSWTTYAALCGTAFAPALTALVTLNIVDTLSVWSADPDIALALRGAITAGGELTLLTDQGVFHVDPTSHIGRIKLVPYAGDLGSFFLVRGRDVVNSQMLRGATLRAMLLVGRVLPDNMYVSWDIDRAPDAPNMPAMALVPRATPSELPNADRAHLWATRALRAVIGADAYGTPRAVSRALPLPPLSLADIAGSRGRTVMTSRGFMDGVAAVTRAAVFRGGRGGDIDVFFDDSLRGVNNAWSGSRSRGFAIYVAGGDSREAGRHISEFLDVGAWPEGSDGTRGTLLAQLRLLFGFASIDVAELHPSTASTPERASALWARYAELLSVLPFTPAQRCVYSNATRGSEAELQTVQGRFDSRDIGRCVQIHFDVGVLTAVITGVYNGGTRATVSALETPSALRTQEMAFDQRFNADVFVIPVYGYKTGSHAVVTEYRPRTQATPNTALGATNDTAINLSQRQMRRLVERGDSRPGDRSVDEMEITAIGADGLDAEVTLRQETRPVDTERPVTLRVYAQSSPMVYVPRAYANRGRVGSNTTGAASIPPQDSEPIALFATGYIPYKRIFGVDGVLHDMLTIGQHSTITLPPRALAIAALSSEHIVAAIKEANTLNGLNVTDSRFIGAVSGVDALCLSADAWAGSYMSSHNQRLASMIGTVAPPVLIDFLLSTQAMDLGGDAYREHYPSGAEDIVEYALHLAKWRAYSDTVLYLAGMNASVRLVEQSRLITLDAIASLGITVGTTRITTLAALLAAVSNSNVDLYTDPIWRAYVLETLAGTVEIQRGIQPSGGKLHMQLNDVYVHGVPNPGAPGPALTFDSVSAAALPAQATNISNLGVRATQLSSISVVPHRSLPIVINTFLQGGQSVDFGAMFPLLVGERLIPVDAYALDAGAVMVVLAGTKYKLQRRTARATYSIEQTDDAPPDGAAPIPARIRITRAATPGTEPGVHMMTLLSPAETDPLTPPTRLGAAVPSPLGAAVKLVYDAALAPTDFETRALIRSLTSETLQLSGRCGVYVETRVDTDQEDTVTRTPMADRRLTLNVLNGGHVLPSSVLADDTGFSARGALNVYLRDTVGSLYPKKYNAAVNIATDSLASAVSIRSDTMLKYTNYRYAYLVMPSTHAALRVHNSTLVDTRTQTAARLPSPSAPHRINAQGVEQTRVLDVTEITSAQLITGQGAQLSVVSTTIADDIVGNASRRYHLPAQVNIRGSLSHAAITDGHEQKVTTEHYRTLAYIPDPVVARAGSTARKNFTERQTRPALFIEGVTKLRGVLSLSGNLPASKYSLHNLFSSQHHAGVHPHINPLTAPRASITDATHSILQRVKSGNAAWFGAPGAAAGPDVDSVRSAQPTSTLYGSNEAVLPQLGERVAALRQTYTLAASTAVVADDTGELGTFRRAGADGLLYINYARLGALGTDSDRFQLYFSRPYMEMGDALVGRSCVIDIKMGSAPTERFVGIIDEVVVVERVIANPVPTGYVRVTLSPAVDRFDAGAGLTAFFRSQHASLAESTSTTGVYAPLFGPLDEFAPAQHVYDVPVVCTLTIHGREWSLNAFSAQVSDRITMTDDAGQIGGTLNATRGGDLEVSSARDLEVSSARDVAISAGDAVRITGDEVYVNDSRVDTAFGHDTTAGVEFYATDLHIDMTRPPMLTRPSSPTYPVPFLWKYADDATGLADDAGWSVYGSLRPLRPAYRTDGPSANTPESRFAPSGDAPRGPLGTIQMWLPMRVDRYDELQPNVEERVLSGPLGTFARYYEPRAGTGHSRSGSSYLAEGQIVDDYPVSRTHAPSEMTSTLTVQGYTDIFGEIVYLVDGKLTVASVVGSVPLLRATDPEYVQRVEHLYFLPVILHTTASIDDVAGALTKRNVVVRIYQNGAVAPLPDKVAEVGSLSALSSTLNSSVGEFTYTAYPVNTPYGWSAGWVNMPSDAVRSALAQYPRDDMFVYSGLVTRAAQPDEQQPTTWPAMPAIYIRDGLDSDQEDNFSNTERDFVINAQVKYIALALDAVNLLATTLHDAPNGGTLARAPYRPYAAGTTVNALQHMGARIYPTGDYYDPEYPIGDYDGLAAPMPRLRDAIHHTWYVTLPSNLEVVSVDVQKLGPPQRSLQRERTYGDQAVTGWEHLVDVYASAAPYNVTNVDWTKLHIQSIPPNMHIPMALTSGSLSAESILPARPTYGGALPVALGNNVADWLPPTPPSGVKLYPITIDAHPRIATLLHEAMLATGKLATYLGWRIVFGVRRS